MRRLGRKGLQWARVKRLLKPRFLAAGITTCEIRLAQCWRDSYLSFSHTKRRADMRSEEDLKRVVLACGACATAAHGMGKVVEEAFLENIILNREIQP